MQPHTDIRDVDKNIQLLWFNRVDPKKVNLGVAYYARGYTMSDKSCRAMGCSFSGPSNKGPCSDFEGYLMNSEIQKIIKDKSLTPELLKDAMVKQVSWDDQWVAYEDWDTLAMKMEYANDHCLGGTFIWSLDFGGDSG